MHDIKKVAVIGSGVMGSAIAAHIANSKTKVLLFDIPSDDKSDRSKIAKDALQKLLKADPEQFTHKRNAKLVTCCNLDDDYEKLAEVDWIVEAVVENLDIKKDLYAKLDKVRKKDSIVSSNTSTIPLARLIEGSSAEFAKDFLITHFFNPPRYMRLVELVCSEKTDQGKSDRIRSFLDQKLGKTIVDCKDTPGFIANRIGCFWLAAGVNDAIAMNVTVEEADSAMSRPVGIPKTGVFGLMDLIGIDLMPLIAKEMYESLPKDDGFLKIYKEHDLVIKMIKDGYTGRKGKGGFYRLNKEDGKKVKESISLQDGSYSVSIKPKLESVEAARGGLRKLLTHEDNGGRYAWAVLSKTLSYAASLVPEISDDIYAIDEAMRLGYNWKYGPFELIDKLGENGESGAKWLAGKLAAEGAAVPEILTKIGNDSFYKTEGDKRTYFDLSSGSKEITIGDDHFMLFDKVFHKEQVLKNASAKLWDIGDGIACLEFKSKMNSVDPLILEMMVKSVDKVKEGFKGLVIANDGDNFCVGANIGILLFAANVAAWREIHDIIKQGQDTYMALKYAPFPVVAAPSGMALGGGCELLMHCDSVQAHVETYTGLVEVGVGIVPGWGGCKEMLFRHIEKRQNEQSAVAKLGRMFSGIGLVRTANTMPAISSAFEYIATARVAKSAEQAKDMLILTDKDDIVMNRKSILPAAKKKCLELAGGYEAPNSEQTVRLPGKTGRVALDMAIKSFVKSGKATKHDAVISGHLAYALTGGNTDINQHLTEQDLLDLEREAFMELVKMPYTLDRLEHMLTTGKPLRN